MSEAMQEPSGFNLWNDPWIRVVDRNCNISELSIGDCLRRAREFHALSDPSPLVVGGTHRLLAAILQWISPPRDVVELREILDTGHFIQDQLDRFETEYADRFELFHPTRPFLQSGDIPLDGGASSTVRPKRRNKTANADGEQFAIGSGITWATRLVIERPGGNNRAHFWHLKEDHFQLCPACSARALVVIPAFARSEGGGSEGYTYSVNGVPPLYLLPLGNNLFESLALSLLSEPLRPVADMKRSKVAPWTDTYVIQHKHEVKSVGYFEALTFPARRVRLLPRSVPGRCSLCGILSDVTIAQVFYRNGHRLPKEEGARFWWQDPFVAYKAPREKDKTQTPSGITLKAGQVLWREHQALLRLHDDSNEQRSKYAALWLQQLGTLIDDERRFPAMEQIRVRCVGMRVSSDAKIFEWIDEALEAPAGLLRDDRGLRTVAEMIGRANTCNSILYDVFNRHFISNRGLIAKKKNDRENAVRFKTVRTRMLEIYWMRLAEPFRDHVQKSGDREQRQQIKDDWTKIVLDIAGNVFEESVKQLGERGELLRMRVRAHLDFAQRLRAKRREWIYDS